MDNMNGVVWVHLVAAVLAVGLTVSQFAVHKGTRLHKAVGRVWLITILTVAMSSFWIRELGGLWGFSWIHILSVMTIIGAIEAYVKVKRGNISGHRKQVIVLSFGLFIAGAFAMLPGRRLGEWLWG